MNRYVITVSHGTIEIEDTLKTNTIYVGIDEVKAISVGQSDIEELYVKLGKILGKHERKST